MFGVFIGMARIPMSACVWFNGGTRGGVEANDFKLGSESIDTGTGIIRRSDKIIIVFCVFLEYV